MTQIAAGDAGEQSDENYGVIMLKLRDEIARFYQIGLAHWETFEMNRAGNASAPIGFVQSLLRDCFGFGTLQKSTGKVFSERRLFNFGSRKWSCPCLFLQLQLRVITA